MEIWLAPLAFTLLWTVAILHTKGIIYYIICSLIWNFNIIRILFNILLLTMVSCGVTSAWKNNMKNKKMYLDIHFKMINNEAYTHLLSLSLAVDIIILRENWSKLKTKGSIRTRSTNIGRTCFLKISNVRVW